MDERASLHYIEENEKQHLNLSNATIHTIMGEEGERVYGAEI